MAPTRGIVRGLGLAIVAIVFVGLVSVFTDGGGDLPPAGARVTVAGRATVVHLDGSTETLSTGDVVRAGEEVRAQTGTVLLELAAGGVLEGRGGTGDADATRVVVDERPELVAGELLVQGDQGVAIEAAGTDFDLAGDDAAARLERGLSVTAAAYRGALEIDSAGQERTVPALRQLGIATLGRPPRTPEPLQVRESDPWDRRFLGAAIDLTQRLDAVSRVFTVEAPANSARNPGVYETVLPALLDEPAFATLLQQEPERPAGEVLVGAAIAALASGGPFADRWDDVFSFRDAGAEWGLVALDQRVHDDVLRAIESGLDDDDGSELATPVTVPVDGTPAATGDTDDDDSPTLPVELPPTTPTTAPDAPPAPGPTPLPLPAPPTIPIVPLPPLPGLPPTTNGADDGIVPPTGVPLLDGLIDPIDQLLGGLLGG